MMQLYGPALSNNVFRPLLVARHLDLPVENVAVDLMRGAHKAADFLKLNPAGRIPVLVDGDYALWESLAITHYLAGQVPSPIWPDDLQARATITSWQAFGLAHLGRAIGTLQFQRIFKAMFGRGGPDEAIVAEAEKNFAAEAAILESRLSATNGWLVRDDLTLADLDLGGWFLHDQAAGLAMEAFPETRDWLIRLRALPAWAAASAH